MTEIQLNDRNTTEVIAKDHRHDRTILPVCSYAKAVLTRTEEYHDVL
jgi:predicted GNAT family acetyltransferase